MGLWINYKNTKFIVLFRRYVNQFNLILGNYIFGTVDSFKYLGVNKNSSNSIHKTINERISKENKYYYNINKLLTVRSSCVYQKIV